MILNELNQFDTKQVLFKGLPFEMAALEWLSARNPARSATLVNRAAGSDFESQSVRRLTP